MPKPSKIEREREAVIAAATQIFVETVREVNVELVRRGRIEAPEIEKRVVEAREYFPRALRARL